jgi:NAD-dependent DNA ligase
MISSPNFVVVGENGAVSSKGKRATALSVPLLDEQQFIAMLNAEQ